MSHVRLVVVPVLSIVLVLAAAAGVPRLAHAQARPGARPTRGPANTNLSTSCSPSPWRVVSSPNPSNVSNILYGVAAVSSSNVWAVGSQSSFNGSRYTNNSLVEHWNGSAWSAVSNPNPSTAINEFYSVAAVSASDIWAVGDQWDVTINDMQTLAEHWNGTSWQVVPTYNPTTFEDQLLSVATVSANDVWAVGSYGGATDTALIEHWNGTSWSVVTIPNAGAQGYLDAVVAIAANDVWAVGDYSSTSGPSTLIEHWDGTSWQLVASPNVGPSGGELTSLAAISATDIWAAGWYSNASGGNAALAEHWNGTAWSVVTTPDPMGGDVLTSVTAASSSSVWAGGNFFDSTTGADEPYYEHWNGSAWTAMPGPNLATTDFSVNGLVATSTIDVWAVGSENPNSSTTQTLAEHYTTLLPRILCFL